MLTKSKIMQLLSRFEQRYPNPRPKLIYHSDYELLVAVMLSAQCTDERVNLVTEKLFLNYNTPEKMVTLSQEELEKMIFSCGLYRMKAQHILSASRDILTRFNGQVPATVEQLRSLDGVGVKTANVVYSVSFGGDAIAVDTHVFRVSNRIGLSSSTTPAACEKDLQKALPQEKWSKAHHYLIFLGREICKAQKPDCANCFIADLCQKKIVKKTRK